MEMGCRGGNCVRVVQNLLLWLSVMSSRVATKAGNILLSLEVNLSRGL
jgi:hypothetical protein